MAIAGNPYGNTIGADQPIATPTPVTTPADPAAATSTTTGGLPANVVAAANAIFAAEPSQQASFQNQYGGNMQAWLQSFTQWWSNFGNQVAGQMQNFGPEASLLSALGYTQGGTGNWSPGPSSPVVPTALSSSQLAASTANVPTEEGLYDESIGSLNNQVLNDANLAQTTQQLESQTGTDYSTLNGVLGSAISAPGGISQVTAQEQTAASTAATAQLQALAASVSAMSGTLTGNLAAQQQALLQSIQQQITNANTYGDAASQALSQQIQTQLGDLQTSIGQQQTALQTEIQQLSGAADASSQAQLAALQTQLQQLNAAEAPVADATTKAAQAQVTAVNMGEAQAKNQIQGQQALQGFVGGSSELDNALVQAGIQAQQAGAADVGAANVENAQAYQTIANTGANTQANIANNLAQQQQAIAGQSATGTNTLADALATGTQNLNDTGAAGQAAIKNTVAGQIENAQDTGATTGYGNTAAEIAAQNSLAATSDTDQFNIASTEAQQQEENVDQNYSQSLSAALAQTALPGQEASELESEDNLQNTGLLDAQNALNWWSTSSAAPTPTASTTTASSAGNTIAAGGTGLLNAAVSVGNSNKWWQSPTTTTGTNTPSSSSGIGSSTNVGITDDPNVGDAGGGLSSVIVNPS
jgi:hypothetical protein